MTSHGITTKLKTIKVIFKLYTLSRTFIKIKLFSHVSLFIRYRKTIGFPGRFINISRLMLYISIRIYSTKPNDYILHEQLLYILLIVKSDCC